MITRRVARNAVAGLLAGFLATAALTGCAAQSHTSAFTATPDASLRQPTDLPTGLTINREVRKHIAITDCRAVGSRWLAAGTLDNPDSTSHAYELTVFFTTPAATVVAHSSTTLTVGAGGKASWQVDVVNGTHGPLSCVLTGVSQR